MKSCDPWWVWHTLTSPHFKADRWPCVLQQWSCSCISTLCSLFYQYLYHSHQESNKLLERIASTSKRAMLSPSDTSIGFVCSNTPRSSGVGRLWGAWFNSNLGAFSCEARRAEARRAESGSKVLGRGQLLPPSPPAATHPHYFLALFFVSPRSGLSGARVPGSLNRLHERDRAA